MENRKALLVFRQEKDPAHLAAVQKVWTNNLEWLLNKHQVTLSRLMKTEMDRERERHAEREELAKILSKPAEELTEEEKEMIFEKASNAGVSKKAKAAPEEDPNVEPRRRPQPADNDPFVAMVNPDAKRQRPEDLPRPPRVPPQGNNAGKGKGPKGRMDSPGNNAILLPRPPDHPPSRGGKGEGQKGHSIPRAEPRVRITRCQYTDYRNNPDHPPDDRGTVHLTERVDVDDARQRARSRGMQETAEYQRYWRERQPEDEEFRRWFDSAWLPQDRNTRSRHDHEEDRAFERHAENRGYSRSDQSYAGSRGRSTWSPSLPPPATLSGGERLRTRSPRERRVVPAPRDGGDARRQWAWKESDWNQFQVHRDGSRRRQ